MVELVTINPEENRDADVIAVLEDALKEARDGKIASVALAVVYRDDVILTRWVTSSATRILGAVARLMHKIQRDMDAQ